MSFAARRSKKPKAVRRRFSNSDDDDEILPTQVKSTDTSAKTNTNTSMNTETTTVTSTGTDTVNKSIGMSIGGQPANAATHSSVSIGGSGSTIVGKTSEDIKDADSANSVAFKKRAKGR
ncbi:hypothetical protein SARC_11834 [Sphaeroforma arctica JP610]|uniref:Uncharacterized protein n=1 Tax=Sphaeroforma arctica JP610 TaxID=667725 RepID=A0A0L0FGR6_9EUKA|nr:hypothetical protein SARC_11834 [Sphaeroforma arctica JP610]KNC75646.1 hypothetical protein SARC_11834 [Sphaeroforma arctica JP610]|eukprot:XP_014149548.1 hypothetical protein SARC_11834 [Sphaeroforma arctica JP610]